MIPGLKKYCLRWSRQIEGLGRRHGRIGYFREELPRLLLDRDCLRAVVQSLAGGDFWPGLRAAGLFDHEVLLYLDPGRRFSLRLYFHGAGERTVIHDHSAWGVSGTPSGRLSVISYDLAGMRDDGTAILNQRRRLVLAPGETEVTLPYEGGIHQTGSADETPNTMISVYGPPGRRLFIRTYDPVSGRIEERYSPRILRRRLAGRALPALAESDPD